MNNNKNAYRSDDVSRAMLVAGAVYAMSLLSAVCALAS